MKRDWFVLAQIPIALIVFLSLVSCGSNINTVFDSHFDESGYLQNDTLAFDSTNFQMAPPKSIKFFIEVSGSMNGFFRPNAPTKFKEDVWRILSYYAPIIPDVTILTNDGDQGASIPLSSFQTQMNTGAFVSSASTKVPEMINSIIGNLNVDAGEVAVLISDMKYSPVGSAAPQVLLTQYSTDISTIFGKFGKAVSLVGATSQYLDKSGSSLCDKSPYYFLIMGNQENVAEVRNGISTLLENNEDFIGNIDSGFDFGAPSYSFGIPDNCYQLDDQPTFVGYDPADGDTCVVKLQIDLANYRWMTANEEVFPQIFQCKALYGSEVKSDKVEYQIQNITDKNLKRTATAIVYLKVYNMAQESDVIEWTLKLPDMDITEFAPYLNATRENDYSKSYSLEDFIRGMFYGGVVNKSLNTNYILISQNS